MEPITPRPATNRRSLPARAPAESAAEELRLTSLKHGNVVAQRAVQMLRQIDKLATGRILFIEPESPALGHAVRKLGFHGERWALVADQPPLPADLERDMESAYERCDVRTWSATIARTDHVLAAEYGQFDVVVAWHPLQLVSVKEAPELFAWLQALLVPRGFLILRESSVDLHQVVPLGLQAGFLPVADELAELDGPCHTDEGHTDEHPQQGAVAVMQMRGAEECRQTSILRRVTLAEIDERPVLREGIITTYREVFGGDEWCEWVRCVGPDCGRQYSRGEAQALERTDRCVCGWPEPMEPYHRSASVMAEMRHDLDVPASSCCYVRSHTEHGVDAFVWGYVTRLEELAQVLLPDEQQEAELARQVFAERVRQLVAAQPSDGPGRIYYQAQIGALEEVRSFGLLRGLFHRALQFAADQESDIVVTRTSPRTSVYPLLLGIGMRIVYRYGEEPDGMTDSPAAATTADEVDTAKQDTQDVSVPRRGVPRVVLAGELDSMLRLFYTNADRRVIVQIAHQLRQQPDAIQAAHQRRREHEARSAKGEAPVRGREVRDGEL